MAFGTQELPLERPELTSDASKGATADVTAHLARMALLKSELEAGRRSPLDVALGWGAAIAFSLIAWAAAFSVVRLIFH